jgi:hypothetical protein
MFNARTIPATQSRFPQSGLPGVVTASRPAGGGSDADIVVKNEAVNRQNPYGIAGQQGPSINIGRALRAVRGREAPPIAQVERRIDPQFGVHGRQQQIPGRENPSWMLTTNTFDQPGRGNEVGDPESLARRGDPSMLSSGQMSGVGMQDTTRSAALLNESPAPTRIPRFWNDGLNAAAGIAQFGTIQQNSRLFIKHQMLGRVPLPTRGVRSISGVGAQMSTASVIRIPAIFIPSAVG